MVFSPTYLYIKQHSITGKLYFGKTIKSDPIKYKGSGSKWETHYKIHGKEFVITLWYQLYDNPFDLVADALSMSKSFDIVNNESWLNQIIETGIGSGSGYKRPETSKETRLKLSIANIGKHSTNKGLKRDIHMRNRLSQAVSGRKNWRTYLINVQTPDGTILYNITMRELCDLYNLKYITLRKHFYLNKSHKWFIKISN